MRGSIIKTCVVCGKEFYCYLKTKHRSSGRLSRGKRKHNSITCSKICSKKYIQTYRNYRDKDRAIISLFEIRNNTEVYFTKIKREDERTREREIKEVV